MQQAFRVLKTDAAAWTAPVISGLLMLKLLSGDLGHFGLDAVTQLEHVQVSVGLFGGGAECVNIDVLIDGDAVLLDHFLLPLCAGLNGLCLELGTDIEEGVEEELLIISGEVPVAAQPISWKCSVRLMVLTTSHRRVA